MQRVLSTGSLLPPGMLKNKCVVNGSGIDLGAIGGVRNEFGDTDYAGNRVGCNNTVKVGSLNMTKNQLNKTYSMMRRNIYNSNGNSGDNNAGAAGGGIKGG